jgi:hypothetical protein
LREDLVELLLDGGDLGEGAAALERVLEDLVAGFELLLQDGWGCGRARVHEDDERL